MKYGVVVVGTDGSDSALGAVDRAAEVETRLVEGDAAHVLLQIAEKRAANLIVVGGNRGINTRLGRILGAVPSVVSQRAPCDVLVVHTVEGGGKA